MAVLYINNRGEAHRKHSYSAGLDFETSPLKYYLKRIVGWKQKDDRASFKFGRALEAAIQHHHDNSGQGGLEKFTELWAQHEDEIDLKFTRVESDWATLNKMGQDMMRLYIIRQPSLPIPLGGGSVFQREYSKILFDGDPNYGEIEFAGKLDIITYNSPDHPSLSKINWDPSWGLLRPIVIDIKTAAVNFPDYQGFAAHDKQLKVYSWLSGIQDVGLLWFVKKGFGYKKGSMVTLLVNVGPYSAGSEMLVASTSEDGTYLVNSQSALDDMDTTQGRKANGTLDSTKSGQAKKSIWLENHGVLVDSSDFTRQRLQFNTGRVSLDAARDAGIVAGQQVVAIVNSWNNNSWPNKFGIRYPNDDTRDPYFRAFVLGDENFKNENFKLANPDELDDLFEDEPDVESD